MDFWQSIGGMAELELTSADLQGALGRLSARDIPLQHIVYVSDLTVRIRVRRRDVKALQALCHKRGDQVRVSGRFGIYWLAKCFLARPVLVLGCLLYLALVAYLPTRVLFVRVEGNSAVPANAILEAADRAGIRFGVSRRDVRSEKIKNTLLDAIPQLQWAGVNTSGCVAVISVRERTQAEPEPEEGQVSSIVAAADGRVYACTATQGTLLCQEGELVRKGQVLISGYTDCGLSIRAGQAEGEVYAQTARLLAAVTPCQWTTIREVTGETKKYALIFGKNRINFWKDSGNWDTTCGRIYKEYYMTLPGGFSLPLGIAVETIRYYETTAASGTMEEADTLLTALARQAVKEQMVAGTLDAEYPTVTQEEGVFRLEGVYACREMIGRHRQEQIGETYVKNDG